jgi:phage-related protein
MKDLHWQGSSYQDYRDFPEDTQDDLGYQLQLVQLGRDPRDWKVLKSLGKGISGVYEIRTSTNSDIYRVAYVTKIADSIVILHSWQKKTEATAKSDINLIIDRYRSAMKELT